MYKVSIKNDNEEITIHSAITGNVQKLKSGNIVQSENTIDSFTFCIYPNNIGFNKLNEYKTKINVYNTKKHRYEFQGRILKLKKYMSTNGLIYKEVVCENLLGYLCDSQQKYVKEKNWTLLEFLTHIIDCHNEQVEKEKQFKLGEVTVTIPNDNVYVGIQRETTWKTISDKLINSFGGIISFRKEDDGLYLDYKTVEENISSTKIKLKSNMKSITNEIDPTSFITRLIPLGTKIKTTDSSGQEIDSEERIGIESVNDGKYYLDDELAISRYGIIVGSVSYDDVTEPSNLLTKAQEYLKDNNKILNKFSITALDLSLINLELDDFKVGNSHYVINDLVGVNELLRITKKTIDINNPASSSLEFGDTYKTLSDLQLSSNNNISSINNSIKQYTTSTDVLNLVSNSIEKIGVITKNILFNDNEGTIILDSNNKDNAIQEIVSNLSQYFGYQANLYISCANENHKIYPIILQNETYYFSISYINESNNYQIINFSLDIENNSLKFSFINSYIINSSGINTTSNISELKLHKLEIIS